MATTTTNEFQVRRRSLKDASPIGEALVVARYSGEASTTRIQVGYGESKEFFWISVDGFVAVFRLRDQALIWGPFAVGAAVALRSNSLVVAVGKSDPPTEFHEYALFPARLSETFLAAVDELAGLKYADDGRSSLVPISGLFREKAQVCGNAESSWERALAQWLVAKAQ